MEIISRTLKTLHILLSHISVFFALFSILELFLFLNYVYVCVSLLCAHLSAGTHSSEEVNRDALQLELQVIVDYIV